MLNKIKIPSMIVLTLLMICSYVFAETQPTDKDIFEKRLSEVLTLAGSQNANKEGLRIAIEALTNFSKEYPNSEFASDAQVVPIFVSYHGSSSDRKRYWISRLEEIDKKYPERKLTDLTSKKMMELAKEDSSGPLGLPYKYLIVCLKGDLAFDTDDHQSVITNFILLKNWIGANKIADDNLTHHVYLSLFRAYKALGKTEEAKGLANEAIANFPENVKLMQFIQDKINTN